jgi:hypothetical protein
VPDGCGLALWEEVGDGELDATCVVTWEGVGEADGLGLELEVGAALIAGALLTRWMLARSVRSVERSS